MDDDGYPSEPIEIDWPPRPLDGARPGVDWRRLVGGLGRVLIACGLLLFGFVAYQLWGTSIQQARSQDQLQDRFEALLRPGSTTAADATPATTAGATPGTTSAARATGTTAVAAGAAGPTTTDGAPSSAGGSSAPPSAGGSATGVLPPVREGQPMARLVIPRIGVDQVVISGVELEDLKKGPGHYPDTPLPGQIGNAAIAGHRSTFGAPFARVDELQAGDEIQVTRLDGARFVYRVTDSRVVEPTEVSVIADTPDPILTLTSCWPKWSADKRIVIRAALDRTASAPATPPPPTTAAPAPATPSTAPAASGGDPATVTATVPATTATATPVAADGTTSATAAGDAFQQGWWSDDRAWGDVMAWGSTLAGVALAAWWLSRRVRRNWVGAAVGIGPFVVVLYFFYENAARLLPPNI